MVKIHPGSIIAILIIISGLIFTYLRKANLSLSLVIINILILFLTIATSPQTSVPTASPIVDDLDFGPSDLLDGKAAYTLITSMYLHSGAMHIIFNMLALVFLGVRLEEKIGALRFGALYFISGICAGLLFGIVGLFLEDWTSVIGASGGVFGILAAYARLYPQDEFMIFPIPKPLPISNWAGLFLGFAMIMYLVSLYSPGQDVCCWGDEIAHIAHIGGFIAGYFLAPSIMKMGGDDKATTTKKIDFSALEQLAKTDYQRKMLANIKKEDEPDVRDAWLEHFLTKVQCPKCGKRMQIAGRKVKCECGFEVKY